MSCSVALRSGRRSAWCSQPICASWEGISSPCSWRSGSGWRAPALSAVRPSAHVPRGRIRRPESDEPGEKLLHEVEKTGSVVYVVFFATAGAHLDIPLLKSLWQVALTLAVSRAFITWVASRTAARLAEDPPVLRRWGWSSLVSQAGLTLGLSVIVEREFPSFGGPFRALAIATVALNEVAGPILFKLALDRAGEASKREEPAIEAEGA